MWNHQPGRSRRVRCAAVPAVLSVFGCAAVIASAGPAAGSAPAAVRAQAGPVLQVTFGGHHYLVRDLTARPARALGRALRQARASRTRGGAMLHTLTLTATNLAGMPDTGDSVFVMNVDNSARFSSTGGFRHGAVTFSVPAGNYFALGFFLSASKAVRLVAVPQFAVPADRPATSVAVNEPAAASRVTFATPRPSVVQDVQFDVLRMPRAGIGLDVNVDNGAVPIWVSSVKAARALTGTLRTAAKGLLYSPSPGTVRYQYDLAYQSADSIPAQHYLVRASSLASVDERLFQAGHAGGGYTRFGYFAWEGGFGGELYPLTLPARRTEYLTANRAVRWADSFVPSYAYETTAPQVFTAGEHARGYWNAGPLHAGVNILLDGVPNLRRTWPSATRAGNTLTLDVTPFTDNQPGHEGPGFDTLGLGKAGTVTGSYQIDQNGKKIAGGNAVKPAHDRPDLRAEAELTPRPAQISFTLNADRRGKLFGMSTSSHTVWTWESARQPGTMLPKGWACPGAAACAVQPLMTLEYTVARLGLTESAPPGKQVLHISAGHLQFAASPTITSAVVSVSFDGGKIWDPAQVTGRDGSYQAVFTAPPGVTVALRTRAADAAGGTISETITGAYRTAA